VSLWCPLVLSRCGGGRYGISRGGSAAATPVRISRAVSLARGDEVEGAYAGGAGRSGSSSPGEAMEIMEAEEQEGVEGEATEIMGEEEEGVEGEGEGRDGSVTVEMLA
jgi:hypothetical protein